MEKRASFPFSRADMAGEVDDAGEISVVDGLGKVASEHGLRGACMNIPSNTRLSRGNKSDLLSGDLRIYSAPTALIRHIQWSLNHIFDEVVTIQWSDQKLSPGSKSCQIEWRSHKPLASKIAAALKSWHYLRFEVREYCVNGGVGEVGGEGVLYRCTPDLGLHQAVTGSTGDVMIHENRLMTIMESSRSYESLRESLANALGSAWDAEIECYRRGLLNEALPLRVTI